MFKVNNKDTFSSVSIVNFRQGNAGGEVDRLCTSDIHKLLIFISS